jgi:hypothetical protein
MEGLAHAPTGEEALGKLILFADYPKMGLHNFLRLDFDHVSSNPNIG